jgi:hypothetical protein
VASPPPDPSRYRGALLLDRCLTFTEHLTAAGQEGPSHRTKHDRWIVPTRLPRQFARPRWLRSGRSVGLQSFRRERERRKSDSNNHILRLIPRKGCETGFDDFVVSRGEAARSGRGRDASRGPPGFKITTLHDKGSVGCADHSPRPFRAAKSPVGRPHTILAECETLSADRVDLRHHRRNSDWGEDGERGRGRRRGDHPLRRPESTIPGYGPVAEGGRTLRWSSRVGPDPAARRRPDAGRAGLSRGLEPGG